MNPTGKQKIFSRQIPLGDPGLKCLASLFGQLEAYRSPGLVLQHSCPREHLVSMGDIPDAQCDKVASAQLAIDGEIEQGKIAQPVLDL